MFEGCLSREESARYDREEKEKLKKDLKLALELIKSLHQRCVEDTNMIYRHTLVCWRWSPMMEK